MIMCKNCTKLFAWVIGFHIFHFLWLVSSLHHASVLKAWICRILCRFSGPTVRLQLVLWSCVDFYWYYSTLPFLLSLKFIQQSFLKLHFSIDVCIFDILCVGSTMLNELGLCCLWCQTECQILFIKTLPSYHVPLVTVSIMSKNIKGAVLFLRVGEVLISLPRLSSQLVDKTTKTLMHGCCDALRPDLWLSSQPQNAVAPWPLPNYTA